MPDRARDAGDDHHCPFLNRADERCGPHFHLDKLGHAFAYCFGRYKTCPHYLELLVERRVRRLTAAATAAASTTTHPGTDGTDADHADDFPIRPGYARPPQPGVFVQLRINPSAAAARSAVAA